MSPHPLSVTVHFHRGTSHIILASQSIPPHRPRHKCIQKRKIIATAIHYSPNSILAIATRDWWDCLKTFHRRWLFYDCDFFCRCQNTRFHLSPHTSSKTLQYEISAFLETFSATFSAAAKIPDLICLLTPPPSWLSDMKYQLFARLGSRPIQNNPSWNVFPKMYFPKCIFQNVFLKMYFSKCISQKVWSSSNNRRSRRGITSLPQNVFLRMYFSKCILQKSIS